MKNTSKRRKGDKDQLVAITPRIPKSLHRAAFLFKLEHGMTLREQIEEGLKLLHREGSAA